MSSYRAFLIAGIFCLFVAAMLFIYAYYIPHPRSEFKDETRYIIVKRGETLSDIAGHLQELGAISSKSNFIFFGKLIGKGTRMKTGRYAIEPSYSMARIMRIITRGEATPFNITIREGYTVAETARLLESIIGLDVEKFKQIVSDTYLLDSLGIEAENLEGYLSPSTYNFFYEEDASRVVSKMVDNFFNTLPDSFEIKANKLGLTFHEAVTLASLVEEEAMIDSERRTIASVFLNRLKKRMRLECDPTVIYAMGGLNRPLLRKDLTYDSPYNTYRNYGLPPGPISNPGLKSLEAVVNPAAENYLYFVARGDGAHIFSYTLRDHINATNHVKRIRQSG
jgi:UPF0755 protein